MSKWDVTLSTTEPYNYVGIIKVRQGNVNTEVLTAKITENGQSVDLTGCKVTLQAVVGNYPVERPAELVDAKNGIVSYVFDDYTMQIHGEHTANFAFYKGDNLIGTTQDFSYFVVRAVSKTPGEMGSYWQTVDDLIADMADFINTNQGDFTDWINARQAEFNTWFESIVDILRSVDPGGVMLAELMDARVDIQGTRHQSITERLIADMEYFYDKLHSALFVIDNYDANVLVILQDDKFSNNHEVEVVGAVDHVVDDGALVVATVDDVHQNTFKLVKVGEIDGRS